MRTLCTRRPFRAPTSGGFTLVELMVTLAVLGVVMIVLSTIIYGAARSRTTTSNSLDASQLTRVAVDLIARDLRQAGYGRDYDNVGLPQPPIAYIDSMQVLISANMDTTVKAYNPAGNPKPHPLSGTAWQPPVKYATGAEVIRWSLDANNDGNVDASDINHANGAEARATQNPGDYMLLRQVYGDSTLNAAGNNGGVAERVSLLRRPADGDVPPLFTVYLFGNPDPWPWANGPIPATRLKDIERIVIRGVGTSPRPNWLGQYASAEYRTEVMVTRNALNFGEDEFGVDGYVYEDQNTNGVKDALEPGVPGATVALQSFTTQTNSSGYFLFAVPAGTYVLKHQPPQGFINITNPDSFIVTVGPPQTHSFANRKLDGGLVKVYTYADSNSNGIQDPGEGPRSGVTAIVSPSGNSGLTNAQGTTHVFAETGGFTVSLQPPVGLSVTSAHPYSGTMANGGADSVSFGLGEVPTGTISGKVFTDNNRNGTYDAGEVGVANVWVGASPDGGATVVGYQYTNASGDYTLTVPSNDPPGTQPYYVTLIVPNGYYPTGSTSLGPLLVQPSQNLTGRNFGVASFQIITLNASRVLSLASADLIEKDWTGNDNQYATKGHEDADIVLGADAGGTDNIAVWFNNYNDSPLFDANPTYTRNAANSVLSMRLGMLDGNAPTTRFDAVTGTKYTTIGNFFVWFAQNSGGNLGYFSATHDQAYSTGDKGDVQAVLIHDVGGSADPDIIVGTKSPTAGQGHIEVWLHNGNINPSFAHDETYPPQGSISGGVMGEVTSMALADLDNDGDRDLVVGTRLGDYRGQLILLENTGRLQGARFREVFRQTFSDLAVTSVVCSDVDGNGRADVVLGGQVSATAGRIEQWGNVGAWLFSQVRQNSSGIVMSMTMVDLGGLSRDDLVVGFRSADPGYAGGVRIYFTDLGVIPPFGTDPSNGAIAHMVPALTVNNFNYGVQPVMPPAPYLKDFAAGIKTGPTTGALVVFVR